jgi:ABC-type bacteriocin/lantibiotic exporter with double-glycine peptidase domain
MVTQDEEVIKLADQIIVLDEGYIKYQGNQQGYQQFLTLNS